MVNWCYAVPGQAKGIGQLVFFKDSEEVSQSSPISYDVPHYGVTVTVDV
jgi:hypothetical protein